MANPFGCRGCGLDLLKEQAVEGFIRCPLCGRKLDVSLPPELRGTPRKSRLAEWSLVMGIMAVVLMFCYILPGIPFAAISLFLGILALNDIRQHRGALTGKAEAWFGVTVGGLIVGGVALLIVVSLYLSWNSALD